MNALRMNGLKTWIPLAAALIALAGLAASAPSQAQVPDARGTYGGIFWISYTNSPWSFAVQLNIASETKGPEGNWAGLSGSMTLSGETYPVTGMVYQSGWTDLYAFDSYGHDYHLSGYLAPN